MEHNSQRWIQQEEQMKSSTNTYYRFLWSGMIAVLFGIGSLSLAFADIRGLLGARGTLWVTNAELNSVAVYDAATGDLIGEPIPVGQRPIGITAPHGTDKVYVSNETNGTVSVISKTSLTVIHTIYLPAGSKPHHVAHSPNGEFVYVAEFGTNKVAVIDTATDTFTEFITGAPEARTHAVGVTRNEETLLATNTVVNELAALDAFTGELLWALPVGNNPSDVVTTNNHKQAFVSIRNEHTVKLVDLTTPAVLMEIPVAQQPTTLQLSPNQRWLVVTHRGGPQVAIIDLHSDAVVTVVEIPGTAAEHNAISQNGRYSFICFEGGEDPGVAVIDNKTATVVDLYAYPGGGRPHGIFYEPQRVQR